MKNWGLFALLYISTADVGNTFTLPVPTQGRQKRTSLFDTSGEAKDTSSRKRRQRCVDFPSNCYEKVPSRSASRTKKGRKGQKAIPFVKLDPSIDAFSPFSDTGLSAGFPLEADLTDIMKNAEKTRLLTSRSYAKKEPFAQVNVTLPPMLNDLSTPPTKSIETYWAGAPFRLVVFLAAYGVFPYLTKFLETFVTMDPDEFDAITSKFTPGISILYGTFVSLTISILYNRQQSIQERVSTEASLIALLERNLLSIFRADKNAAIEASQSIADQIRTLVKSSRGRELMGIMYSDPYARILELIEERELELFRKNNDLGAQGVSLLCLQLMCPCRCNT
uniref:ABC transmembrane type-1 domain-containing protein n=1 Tax=Odontella aurita TaxID=265563 RepID=A0A7S4JUG4_9STRA|mmetsp:Transcript_54496/g.162848  ORF Transcript_54496/g.162848 Transcript_54496/m.162848 type:complete len:335 (+) Transcript_54496:292-1296(+)